MRTEGHTLQDIADTLGVHKTTVSRWLRGVRYTERTGERRRVLHELLIEHIPTHSVAPESTTPGSCNTDTASFKPIVTLFKDVARCWTLDDSPDLPGSCNTPTPERADHAEDCIETPRLDRGRPGEASAATADQEGHPPAALDSEKARNEGAEQLTMFDAIGKGYGYD